jgi:putative transposase
VLKRRGISVNVKKVYRLYRNLDLQIDSPKKPKAKISKPVNLTRAEYRNHIWASDILCDRLSSGRLVRILIVEDIFSRVVAGFRVDFSIRAVDIVQTLQECFDKSGGCAIFRSDNGPQYTSNLLREFLVQNRVKHELIEKGKPFQNGFAESLIGKLKDEKINRDLMDSLTEERDMLYNLIRFYNYERPHSSLGYLTPMEFAEKHST